MFSKRLRIKLVGFDLGCVCYLMHAGLISIFVMLLVVAIWHYEHNINYAFTPLGQTTMHYAVTVITQTFAILYLAGMLWTIQRITLRQDLHTRQTLTSIHDKSSAWLGLCSSLSVLVDQIKIPAAAPKIVLIFLYLGGISVLHIAIPSSFSVTTYNDTIPVARNTVLSRPPSPVSLDPKIVDILQYPIYSQLQQLGLLGLRGNLVYDVVPPHAMAMNNPMVNATVFNVDCGALPGARQILKPNRTGLRDPWVWHFRHGPDKFVVINPPPSGLSTSVSIGLGSLHHLPHHATFFAVSTIPIVDSLGNTPSPVMINPVMHLPDEYSAPSVGSITLNKTVTSFTFVACNVMARNITIPVSGISGHPIATYGSIRPSTRENTTWHNWIKVHPFDPLLQSDFDLIKFHPSMVLENPLLRKVNASLFETTDAHIREVYRGSYKPVITTLDQFILDDLLDTKSIDKPPTSIPLFDLQASLARAFASVVWYQGHLNHTQFGSLVPDKAKMGQVTLELAVTRLRLSLNIAALLVGLAVSCMLFILAVFLPSTGRTGSDSNELTNTGILQITWLLGNNSHFAGIRRPEIQILRQAGMFEVEIDAMMREKMNSSSNDEIVVTELTRLNSIEIAVESTC